MFGASDVALGALESGVSFEKRILDIYQNCKNITAVRKAFAALNRQLDARKNAHAAELRSILLTESREAKGQALEKTKADIDKYLRDVEYWNQFEEPEVDHKLHYWKIDNWGEKIFGSHGVLFLGAFMDNTKLLFPVLLLCDENGEYINFTEDEIVSALEEANDSDVRYFKPTEEEQSYFHRIYARLISEVQDRHDKTVAPTIAYNKKKIENWANVQQEQLHVQLTDAQKEVEEYILAEMAATDTLEKKDIRKKAAEAKKKMDKLQNDLPKRRKEIQDEAQAEIDRFNQSQEINPMLMGARKSILITGYSLSDYFAELVDCVIQKSQEGVLVKFFVNDIESQKAFDRLCCYKGKFLRIYNYPKQEDKMSALHAKVISVDQTDTLITSANLSYHGQEGNIELGARIHSKELAKQVEDIFTSLVFKRIFVEL